MPIFFCGGKWDFGSNKEKAIQGKQPNNPKKKKSISSHNTVLEQNMTIFFIKLFSREN